MGDKKLTTIGDIKKPALYQRIQQEKIVVTEMVYEYQKRTKSLVSRADGHTSSSLTDSYVEDISQQFSKVQHEIIKPLVKLINHNFAVYFQVRPNGEVNLDELKIVMKVECKRGCSMMERFRTPFNILIPFSEYIDYLHIRGNDYDVSVIEAEVNLNVLDLMDIIEMPLAGPTARSQWYAFMVEAVEEAKKDYKLDVVIPVHEGEVTWNIPHSRRIQLKEAYP